jgi:Fe-S-cluster-containing dehydrogenase component
MAKAEKYNIVIDLDRCQGCMACEVACKQENELPVGPRLKQVFTLGPEKIGKKLVMEYCLSCACIVRILPVRRFARLGLLSKMLME